MLNLELQLNPEFASDGSINNVIGISRDLTEHKRAKEALRESEEKFRTVAEQSPNMIFINKKGLVVYQNKKCEEMLGYKSEDLASLEEDGVI